ncbi:MAG TPA: alkaline phosphatase family protein [Armatimonadota bacterium]|jgi:predicted AlkP superfamily pyrophosphatase or phosphodiesterase
MLRIRKTLAAAALAASACAVLAAPRPRVVVLISIDQFRGDYLTRYPDLMLPAKGKDGVGGFRYLEDNGAFFPCAHYTHFPLYTGPGHAVLSTGGTPSTEGIIGNNWYVPGMAKGTSVYCVEDPKYPIVGSTEMKMGVSPRNLRSSTVADELKMATGARAKVLTVSFKDRAAVLLAGRLSDCTIWYDSNTGQWVSSKFYCKDGTLPEWVQAVNSQRLPDAYFNKTWEPLLPGKVAENTWMPLPEAVTPSSTIGKRFPHTYNGGATTPGKAFYGDLWTSPFATEVVLKTALAGVQAMGIGQDETPDFVGINLAANDYVGHAFGPNSAEAFDITLRSDRALADFFRALDKQVPGGLKNVLITVSGDHGVAPIPECMEEAGFHAGRVTDDAMDSAADSALDAAFGADDWVAANVEPEMWLNPDAIARHKVDPREARRVAAEAVRKTPGVYNALTSDQLLEGRLPVDFIYKKVATGYHPKVSGDLMVVTENLWVQGGGNGGTTHGTPWAYDTHLPIVMCGPGIQPGRYNSSASPQQIAPTLAAILGVNPPSACTASPLAEAMQ